MGFLHLPETASLSLKINVVRQRFFAFLAKRQFFPIGVAIVLSFSGAAASPQKNDSWSPKEISVFQVPLRFGFPPGDD